MPEKQPIKNKPKEKPLLEKSSEEKSLEEKSLGQKKIKQHFHKKDTVYDACIMYVGKPVRIKMRSTSGKPTTYPKLLVVHPFQIVVENKEGGERVIYKHAIDYIELVTDS